MGLYGGGDVEMAVWSWSVNCIMISPRIYVAEFTLVQKNVIKSYEYFKRESSPLQIPAIHTLNSHTPPHSPQRALQSQNLTLS